MKLISSWVLEPSRNTQNWECKAISDTETNEKINTQTQSQEVNRRYVTSAARREDFSLLGSHADKIIHNMCLSVTRTNRKKNLNTRLEWKMKMKKKSVYNLILSTETFSYNYFLYVIIWKWAFWLWFKLYV